MTYRTLAQLPAWLRQELPTAAQEVYFAAYNHAFEKGKASDDYVDDPTLAETAHKMAWRRLLEVFEQDAQGRWHYHPIDQDIDKNQVPFTD